MSRRRVSPRAEAGPADNESPREEATDAVESSLAWRAFARCGIAARAAVYLVVGYLALRLALGAAGDPSANPHQQASAQGAVKTMAGLPGGAAVLVILAIGLAAYSLLSLFDALRRRPGDHGAAWRRTTRAVSAWTALVYALFCAWTVSLLLSSSGGKAGSGGSGGKQEEVTAHVMGWPGGVVLVGFVGAVVVITGVVLGWYAVSRRFAESLDRERAGRRWAAVIVAGVAGGLGRSLAFVIVGASVISAAIGFDPAESRGLDGSLRTLAARWYGPYVLIPVAVGLFAYGVYLIAEVHLRRV